MRRDHDFYETGGRAVGHLLANVDIFGAGGPYRSTSSVVVFEPCAGRDAITRPLRAAGLTVRTNDIVAQRGVSHDTTGDARFSDVWTAHGAIDWTITNPPFKDAYPILMRAWRYSLIGVAFLLRLSFLEPTRERAAFLRANPPDALLVLPRYSFTGDGNTDSVTCAWMIWYPRRVAADPRPQRLVVCTDVDSRSLFSPDRSGPDAVS